MRMELGLPPDLQMLIVSKPLMEPLEKQAFEQFTESNQTAIDASTPRGDALAGDVPEDRAQRLARLLRTSFAGVSSLPQRGPGLARRAARARARARRRHAARAEPPFVLMTLRGRLYLRLAAAQRRRDRRRRGAGAVRDRGERGAARRPLRGDEPVTWSQTTSTAWQSLAPPGQEPRATARAARAAALAQARVLAELRSWRSRCGALRRGRRRSAACARRRRSSASGKSSADAAAAVHLHRPVDHLAGHVRRHHLDHRDLGLGGLVAGHVHHPRRLQRQQARHVDLAARLGDALAA